MLSAAAEEIWPFAFEVKCQEKLNLWAAWKQAVANAKEGVHPALVVKRNRHEALVVMNATTFFTEWRKRRPEPLA